MTTLPARFWAKVDKSAGANGCWNWTAAIVNGYGKFWLGEKFRAAHRLAYEAMRGPIPAGLDIDHLCRNRACVNPAHMEPVTRRVNTLRGVSSAAVNAAKTHCDSGHPFDDKNTYRPPGRPVRGCRACNREGCRQYYIRRKLRAAEARAAA